MDGWMVDGGGEIVEMSISYLLSEDALYIPCMNYTITSPVEYHDHHHVK